ncbi:hypothetical protein INR49_023520, partial [Caranx melampygus]
LLIQAGRQAGRQAERGRDKHLVTGEVHCSLWLVHVDPAASLPAWWWSLGTMCTTIMFLSTLALVLRQHFTSRAKTFPKDSGENEASQMQSNRDAEK